ncbi:FABP family protein [Zhihengliuella sp.]|uniref:FABP family protein n=1 Tax=Zhihengliuella sp. TaxID=1954483 RepID=UPI002811CA40|nr:FABP family protein [Zhihengliuella sp.]
MPIEIPTNLTPELVPLSWLLGTWEGSGRLGEGAVDDEYFFQRVEFTENGQPFVQYRAESWLVDEDGNVLRPLAVEQGFWQLRREQVDADSGPGMVPSDVVPALRTADDVEQLRSADGFPIQANIVHPGGISEMYYGTINGPRVQLETEEVMRADGSKDYAHATRIYGLVNGELFWRWDSRPAGEDLAAHASAVLKKQQ